MSPCLCRCSEMTMAGSTSACGSIRSPHCRSLSTCSRITASCGSIDQTHFRHSRHSQTNLESNHGLARDQLSLIPGIVLEAMERELGVEYQVVGKHHFAAAVDIHTRPYSRLRRVVERRALERDACADVAGGRRARPFQA